MRLVPAPVPRPWRLAGILLLLLLGAGSLCAQAAPGDFPDPPELESAVQFWVRVYTELGTNAGFLHDDENLAVVYDTLQFEPGSSPRSRETQVEAARAHYVAALQRIAGAGNAPLTADDQRIRDLWGEAGTPERLREAADHVRFQLGQADRFRQGLLRSGLWQAHIEEVLANRGLPPELGVLPHVESSFNPAAHSKVGAAGLWQFMRSTGRRYLRIDAAVDDRLDPFRATEAAAQLLSYNYRLLGTWPLALTAYNHGAAGMRRAREQVGSSDIVQILRHYRSPTFGFASRNFYASFLAVLRIDRDPQRYFGPLERYPEARFQEVRMPRSAGIQALAGAVHVGLPALRELNPALLPAVWRGRRRVPQGYLLRLPARGPQWSARLLARHLAEPGLPLPPAIGAGGGTVTLAAAAAGAGGASAPAAASGPDAATGIDAGNDATTSAAQARQDSDADARAIAAARATHGEPVSKSQAEALGPAPGPAAPAANADPTDYAVARDGSVVVAAAETLGHYAEWLQLRPRRLRQLNHLRRDGPVAVGRRVRLDFSRVPRAQFEARRIAFHRQLQAAYFAAHRITGTRVYIARPGDSLWHLTAGSGDLPVWLLRQYNPDVDFSDLRPGTPIALPQVQELGSGTVATAARSP